MSRDRDAELAFRLRLDVRLGPDHHGVVEAHDLFVVFARPPDTRVDEIEHEIRAQRRFAGALDPDLRGCFAKVVPIALDIVDFRAIHDASVESRLGVLLNE